MYREFFGLRELPFTITPDTGFFFAHSSHQEALNMLLVAARSGEGFIKVVGEVGTGKTLLCRKFLASLDPQEFVTAYIPNPYLEPMTLLLTLADDLGLAYPPQVAQHELLRRLTRYLLDVYADGRRVVLCLDEVQAMPVETLESLRLLTNLETERRKLLQVVLFGQPELDNRLDHSSVRQLKQRIGFSCRLRPFTLAETEFYLSHRLVVAGLRGTPIFGRRAVRRLFRASRGVPRLINILAHKCLMLAFGEGMHGVTPGHVRLAANDTESAAPASFFSRLRVVRYLAAMITTLAVFAGASLVWGYWP